MSILYHILKENALTIGASGPVLLDLGASRVDDLDRDLELVVRGCALEDHAELLGSVTGDEVLDALLTHDRTP